MEGDLIGVFALLVGLELILGVDNVLVIAILVSRLPEEKRAFSRNLGLGLALVMRILKVIGGLRLVHSTELAWANGPDCSQFGETSRWRRPVSIWSTRRFMPPWN